MNTTTLLSPSAPPCVGDGQDGDHLNSQRPSHLAKFAFLLSSARGEGSDEPVVGFHHDVEMAACFSSRHVAGGRIHNGSMMPVTPPSISSSSLSMQDKSAGGGMQPHAAVYAGSPKKSLLDTAARNMSTPFFTTPDTVSLTAKTVLKNLVTTMEDLMDSRLRSTVSQLVRKGGISNSQMLFRLLSPSQRPIQVATIITRFMLPDGEGDNTPCSTVDDMISIPLLFKAVVDIKVFREVSTVELTCPVTMSGKFDCHDGLLTAADVCFDCVSLLQTMINQARLIVKLAVTKAADISVQIAKWHASKKTTLSGVQSMMSLSLHSLFGSTSSNSLGTLDAPALNSVFHSFSSLSNANSIKSAKHKSVMAGKGVLRESSYGLLRGYSRNNVNAIQAIRNRPINFPTSTNVNATFDLGSGNYLNNSSADATANTASVVRFSSPTTYPNCTSQDNHDPSQQSSLLKLTYSSSLPPQAQLIQAQNPQQLQQEEVAQQDTNGNIHAGLFSWLQKDSMFLTDDKIKLQNAAEAERERLQRDAPMPLRFFTAAEAMGGGHIGLEMVSKSIFGGVLERQHLQNNNNNKNESNGDGHHQGEKRWQQEQDQESQHCKRRR